MRKLIIALCVAAAVAAPLAAAGKSDREALLGEWKVVEGTYSDGSKEKELDMSFAFKPATMTSPMDASELPWSIDEKAKTITAKTAKGSVIMGYKLVDAKTLVIVSMVVKAEKTATIVGSGGTFKDLTLARR